MSKEAAVDTYRKFSSIPSIKFAHIDKRTNLIHTTWSRTEATALEALQFRTIHNASDLTSTASFKVSNEKWNVPSHTQKLTAVLSQLKGEAADVKQYIELWSCSNLEKKIAVENLEEHGQIYEDDGVFGVLAWSPSEHKLLYVAEKKTPKSKSYFSEAKAEATDKAVEGTSFEYKEDWGELLMEKYQPMACVLDLDNKKVTVIDWLPENMSYGQAVWGGDDDTVFVIGWNNDPYKIGLIYCPIRKNTLFRVNLKDKTYITIQTTTGPNDNKKEAMCVWSPVVSRQGRKLVYLDNPLGGPHRHTSRLVVIDVATSLSKQPVDSLCCIPDLHCDRIVGSAWCSDERRIVLSTLCRTRREIIVVDTHLHTYSKISKDGEVGSWELLHVSDDGHVLASCSAPNLPPHLVMGKLGVVGEEGRIEWVRVTQPSELCSPSSLSFSVHSITPPEKDHDYDYILLEPKPKTKKKFPLLVYNHGGPHSAFTEAFSSKLASYCHLGYAILLTNYRGSLGYGEGSIKSLLGKVGVQDVQDIQAAIEDGLKKGWVDGGRMGVVGGSHGGFLTAHCIGQYPDMFKVAIALNPVINFSNMLGVSDIPDWIYTELGFPFDWSQTVPEEMLALQASRSPFAHVKKMKTPLLLAVGTKDRRVPNSQAMQLYHSLKALNKDVKMYVYTKSSHPLSEPETDSDLFVNMVLWISQHINA